MPWAVLATRQQIPRRNQCDILPQIYRYQKGEQHDPQIVLFHQTIVGMRMTGQVEVNLQHCRLCREKLIESI
jgi:hypothetical protein